MERRQGLIQEFVLGGRPLSPPLFHPRNRLPLKPARGSGGTELILLSTLAALRGWIAE